MQSHLAGLLLVDDPVVIVTGTVLKNGVRRVNAFADGGGRAEVKGRAAHRLDFAGRDQAGIHGSGAVGVDVAEVVENGAAAGEIKIRVMREVDDGVLVRFRDERDLQFVFVRECIDRLHVKIAGVTFLAINAAIAELKRRAPVTLERLGSPDPLVETLEPTVQMIRLIVGGERVGGSVQCELACANAVAVTTDQRAKIWAVRHIAVERVVAEHDIYQLAVLVRHLERRDDAAVGHDLGNGTVFVAQRVEIHGRSVRRAESAFGYRLSGAAAFVGGAAGQ